jgi:DNA-binding NarL/FixJ family response regulator
MRVVLVGSAAERARLHAALDRASIDVIAEFDSLAAAQSAALAADAIVLSPDEHEREDEDGEYSEPLTSREVQVLELLAEGLPNKAIAARLGISDQTVKFHVASISGKLGASNRTDAVRRAVRRGLITL